MISVPRSLLNSISSYVSIISCIGAFTRTGPWSGTHIENLTILSFAIYLSFTGVPAGSTARHFPKIRLKYSRSLVLKNSSQEPDSENLMIS